MSHDQSAWNTLRDERDKLAEQNDILRETLEAARSRCFDRRSHDRALSEPTHFVAQALALPNTAADILRQRDARTLREAADRLESYEFITNKPCSNYAEANELRLMADELEANRG